MDFGLRPSPYGPPTPRPEESLRFIGQACDFERDRAAAESDVRERRPVHQIGRGLHVVGRARIAGEEQLQRIVRQQRDGLELRG